jgi:hypothetical protein
VSIISGCSKDASGRALRMGCTAVPSIEVSMFSVLEGGFG